MILIFKCYYSELQNRNAKNIRRLRLFFIAYIFQKFAKMYLYCFCISINTDDYYEESSTESNMGT
jgi:hypothetical protein